MKKKFLFVLLFTFVIFFLGAEEQDNANINENLSFQELFENSLTSGDFSVYENQLVLGLETENPSEEILAEGIFYVYFYGNLKFFDEAPEENTSMIYTIKNLVNSVYATPDYYSVVRFFKGKANNSVLKRFDIGQGILDFLDYGSFDEEIIYYENPKIERKALLDSISEVEAMFQRFSKLSMTDSEDVPMRFSDEAYIKTTEKPDLVFVMKSEPDYKLLYEAYLETGKNIQGISFGKTQDAYYKLIPMLEKLDAIATENGLILSNILSHFSSTILRFYHTSPYILTLLNYNQLQFVIDEIDFMIDFDSYNSRTTELLKK